MATQEGDDDPEPPLRELRGHLDIAVDVVRVPMQKQHDRPVRGSVLVVGHVEDSAPDLLER
jgi:hypothetical protein